jgi:transposase
MRLWREIRDQGYAGSASTVSRLAARLRRQQRAGQRLNPLPPTRHHLTVRQGVMLLLRRPADLTPAHQAARERLCALDSTIATAYALTQDFGILLRERQGERRDAWVAAALASGIREVRGFATGLQGDAAVRAGLTQGWSNGQTEGHSNRHKLMKRQTYGRAGFRLLRIRAIAA